MLETVDHFLIKTYISELRRELHIRGLNQKRIEEVISETQVHLDESMAAAEPQSEEGVRAVLVQFGDAASLAKRLAAEYDGISSRRKYLLPSAFLVVAFFLFRSPFMFARLFEAPPGTSERNGLWIGNHQLLPVIWIGTVFLLVCAVILFGMGYRARKPLIGQFAAVAGGLVLAQTIWFGATSYPVAFGMNRKPEYFQPVRRASFDATLARYRANVEAEREVGKRVMLGKQVFTLANLGRTAPPELRARGSYLLPEGVREVTIGIDPAEIHPSLLAPTWKAAVAGWTESRFGPQGTEADWLINMSPREVEYAQYSVDYLLWVHDQPLPVQLALDFRMVAFPTIFTIGVAMLATNGGWIVWLLMRAVGRARRRISYRSGRQYAS